MLSCDHEYTDRRPASGARRAWRSSVVLCTSVLFASCALALVPAASAQGAFVHTRVAARASSTAPSLGVTPAAASIKPGAALRFFAVTDNPGQAIVWTATGGTITRDGLYVAPLAQGSFRVTAALGDTGVSAVATIVSAWHPPSKSPPGRTCRPTSTRPRAARRSCSKPACIVRAPSPKSGDTFRGEDGATLSGARALTAFTRSGGRWVADGQTQQGTARACAGPISRAARIPRMCSSTTSCTAARRSLDEVGPDAGSSTTGRSHLHRQRPERASR